MYIMYMYHALSYTECLLGRYDDCRMRLSSLPVGVSAGRTVCGPDDVI
jgi:hypothetical protein